MRGSDDFPGGHLDLRRRDDLVRAVDSGRTAPCQLSGAKPGEDDEFKGTEFGWAVNHSSPLGSALVRAGGQDGRRAQESGRLSILVWRHARFIDRTGCLAPIMYTGLSRPELSPPAFK